MKTEKKIAHDLIDAILAEDCKIELFAEGESICNPTNSENLLKTEVGCCDFMELAITKDSMAQGTILLIWGNGEDLISDYTANDLCERVVSKAS